MIERRFSERRLTRETRFIILATDGVWQFVSSQEAVSLVARALARGTVHDAAHALVGEASERWKRDGTASDDISVVVLLLDASCLPGAKECEG